MLWSLLLPAVAAAQETKLELELPGVEQAWSLVPVSRDEYVVLVTPKGSSELALLSSRRPRQPTALPGATRDNLQIHVADRALWLTWLSGDVVHQLSTRTGKLTRRPSPLPGCVCRLAAGSAGEVFLWSDEAAAFLDADGKARKLEASKLKDARIVEFVAGKKELLVMSGEHQRHSLTDDTVSRVDKPDAVPTVKVWFTFTDVGLGYGWVRRAEDKVRVMSNAGVYFEVETPHRAFGVVRDALVYAATREGGVALMRVEFPGGLEAWMAQKGKAAAAEMFRPAPSAELEKDRQKLAQVLEEARRADQKETEALEAKRRAEEAVAMKEAARRTAQWNAEKAESERLAAEYKKKNPPPPPSASRPAPEPADSTPEDFNRSMRAEMTVAAETVHGFSRVILEKAVVDRPGVVYLGTPRVPPEAREVLLMLAGDHRFVSLVGFRFASPIWGDGPRVKIKLQADQLRNLQLYGDVRGKGGATRLPLYVMVFAR